MKEFNFMRGNLIFLDLVVGTKGIKVDHKKI